MTSILESLPDAFLSVDLQWCFTYVNRQAEQLLKRSRQNLIGKNLWQTYPAAVDSIFYQQAHQALIRHTEVAFEVEAPELDLWLEIHVSPAPEGLYIYLRDITARQQTQEALKQSELKFRSMVEAANDIVYLLTKDGVFYYASPNWTNILGHNVAEDIEGHSFVPFVHPEDLAPCSEFFAEVINTGQNLAGVEYRVRHKDGSWKWLTSNASVIKDPEGNVLFFSGIARDITERKQAEAALKESEAQLRRKTDQLEQALSQLQQTQLQLVQSEKMSSLGQLVAGVAHEINNPVNFIHGNLTHADQYTQDLLGLLHLYQEHYPKPVTEIQAEIEAIDLEFVLEDLPKLLSSMKIGTDRIREIVHSLRNFSRLDEAEMKGVDIHEGIDSTLMILQSRLKANPDQPAIEVVKEYGNLPIVDCYPGQLNQVLMNLITNAVDALEDRDRRASVTNTPHPPSTIRICTELTKDNQVVIRIIDNGPGMTEDISRRLFDPFFTTKPVGKGTGLGLSISYQIIVEKHSGKLYCHSIPGYGTEFVIKLPIR